MPLYVWWDIVICYGCGWVFCPTKKIICHPKKGGGGKWPPHWFSYDPVYEALFKKCLQAIITNLHKIISTIIMIYDNGYGKLLPFFFAIRLLAFGSLLHFNEILQYCIPSNQAFEACLNCKLYTKGIRLMIDEAHFRFMKGPASQAHFICNCNDININLSQLLLKWLWNLYSSVKKRYITSI